MIILISIHAPHTGCDMYIKVYTQNGCLHCDRIKSFLKENKLVYYEKNISENKEHYQDLLRLGYPVVPVTLINGKKYVGFDEEVKKALLKGVDLCQYFGHK